jgi:hypothetical protein
LCLVPLKCLRHFRDRRTATAGNHTRANSYGQAPRQERLRQGAK